MEFRIRRASMWFIPRHVPCEGSFLSEGEEYYHIELNSLEELMDLCKKEKMELIISERRVGIPLITIYDDYIE